VFWRPKTINIKNITKYKKFISPEAGSLIVEHPSNTFDVGK
jgi:hypothetical protein